MRKIHVKIGPENDNVIGYARSYSYYDKGKDERIISKDKMSARTVEQNIAGHKKSSISTKIRKYKEQGVLIEDGDNYIVKAPDGSFISLEEDFYKKMLSTFNSDTNNVYAWLYRKYHWCKQNSRPCYFTKGDIVEQALGKYNNSQNRQKVEEILVQLALNGLICFNVLRYKKTFLRELTFIGTKFIVMDTATRLLNIITEGDKETSGSVDDDYEDISENNEVVTSVGLQGDTRQILEANLRTLENMDNYSLEEQKEMYKMLNDEIIPMKEWNQEQIMLFQSGQNLGW